MSLKNNKLYYLLSFIGGIFYALGFPSFIGTAFPPLTLLGFLLYLYSFFKQAGFKNRILSLLCFSLAFNLAGFYWIPATLTEFGEMDYGIALILSSFFSLIIVPHLWILLVLKFIQEKKNLSFGIFTIPLWAYLFTLAETFTPTQFPTAIGQIYIHYPSIVNLAHLGGVSLYSYITYLVLMSVVLKPNSNVMKITLSLFVLLSFVINKPMSNKIDDFKVQVIQANIGNFMKVSSEKGNVNSMQSIYNRYQELSKVRNDQIDLVVWPETAFPESFYLNTPIDKTYVPPLIQDIIFENKVPMLIGGYSNRSATFSSFESEFNSALYFDTESKLNQYYHKMILIPFGETLPFPKPIKRKLAKYITNVSYFAQGNKYSQFETKNQYRFITPICYELLKPYFLRRFLISQEKKTHFMLNLTNDSWYGDTAEPEQHLFLSRWRALEFNIPIIRSTNTGITTLIYPDSTLGKRLEIGEQKNIVFNVPIIEREATFFEKFGFLATILLFLFTTFISWLENLLLKDREA